MYSTLSKIDFSPDDVVLLMVNVQKMASLDKLAMKKLLLSLAEPDIAEIKRLQQESEKLKEENKRLRRGCEELQEEPQKLSNEKYPSKASKQQQLKKSLSTWPQGLANTLPCQLT